MKSDNLHVVNRIAAIIKPKEPYLDWANFVGQTYDTMESMSASSKIILLPISDYNDQIGFIERNYRQIFEMELEGWQQVQENWPTDINLELFKSWFDVEFYALVVDFDDNQLSREEYYSLGS